MARAADPGTPGKIIKDSTLRLADLGTIREHLMRERQRRLDVVVNRRMIAWEGGYLMVRAGDSTQITGPDGVTSAAGLYRPTVTAVETAGKMHRIDVGFLKNLYAEDPPRTDMIDALVNGRLHGDATGQVRSPDDPFAPGFDPYPGNMLLRLLRPDDGEDGLVRAMLSPRYSLAMDNVDVATAIMDGIAQAGVRAIPDTCSLTDRKMTLRFVAPEIAALAPNLLRGFHSPLDGPGGVQRAGFDRPGMRLAVEQGWGGWTVPQALAYAGRNYGAPENMPVVFAGIVATNGDVGGVARTIAPQFRVQACKNGLTLLAESDRRVHLGSTQSEGVVALAADTVDAELALITKQARDAVKTFLDPEWFGAQVADIEALAETPLARDAAKAGQVIREVTRAGKFSQAETDSVWDMWTRSGAVPTVGGLGNAITAASQVVADPDRAVQMDAQALPLMREAAKLAGRR